MSKYNAEIGCFTMAPDVIVKELGLVTACVYGKIWRYEQMSNEVCRAAVETLANDLGVSYNTILSHIKKLIDTGYLKDLTPELRNRPHVYKTTGRLKIEINIVSTHQNLESTHQNLESHSSKFGDESDSLRDNLIDINDNENSENNIFKLYTSTIGLITPNIVDDLKAASEDYQFDWIEKAFKIASENNARNWRYVSRVLENMKNKGVDWTPKRDYKKRDGQKERRPSGV